MKRNFVIFAFFIVILNVLIIFALMKITVGASIRCEEISPNNAIFRLNNYSLQSYSSGRDYEIEYFKNNSWEPLEQKSEYVICLSDLIVINAFSHYAFDINFEEIYGTLEPGNYRISKNITRICDKQEMKLYFEFSIDS